MKQTAKKTVIHVGGNALNRPIDNLVLLKDHPEGKNKINNNFKSKLFITVLKQEDPNVYTIHPMCNSPVHMVN